MPRLDPPAWTDGQLEASRVRALGDFVSSWGATGTKTYEEKVREFTAQIGSLFETSDDLRSLSEDTFLQRPDLLQAARFATAPPISADDLKTLVGGNLGTRKPDAGRARAASRIIRSAWDPIRFPWLLEDRAPDDSERATAILWTASIWAIESMRTQQRNTSARAQEATVSHALSSAGLRELPPRLLQALEDLERGTFTRECRLGDHKCDRPVRLRDGRLLAIECKVSNSAVNSKKRLNNDVGAKAAAWRKSYGEQVIPAAVLAGVYSLGNLLAAQHHDGITLFWAHDLAPLIDFVQRSS